MGNYNSYKIDSNIQSGGMYSNNFVSLQNNIQKLVKKSQSNDSDTIGFNNSSMSTIDFNSMSEYKQNGGALDFLTVQPTRLRYAEPDLNFLQQNTFTKQANSESNMVFTEDGIQQLGLTSEANDSDIQFIRAIIDSYSKPTNTQNGGHNGGCGCGMTDDGFSATSANPVVTPKTNAVNYDILKGGDRFSSTSENQAFTPKNAINYDILKGGDGFSTTSEYQALTPKNAVNYDILKGGAVTEDKHKKHKKQDSSSSSDDDEDDDEESSSEDDEDFDTDSDDEEDDEDSESELKRMKRSSKSSSKSSSTSSSSDRHMSRSKKSKKGKKHMQSKKSKKHASSSQSGGSDSEIIIDAKYLYSSSNNFSGSDSSDYYGHFRNRTLVR